MLAKRRIFRLSMAIGLGLAIAACCLQASAQSRLSSKIVRLHVLANSDSEFDQAIKLKVRDAVLQCGISEHPGEEELENIRLAARECLIENGQDGRVTASFEKIYFETRDYDEFSLPAGYYDAVRVVIGNGEGRNWWCVVYPSLCTGFAEAEAEGVLSQDEINFIKKDGEEYVVRFKLQELISEWSAKLF
ncbi:MAG: stage II sporulation protein R [Clostridiaceae bacterium]|nr:stage II sporulation protein R [Clostridiaceae bacterium]